jgi:ribonuclease HI
MINVDAALFGSSRCMGAAAVVRNHAGNFVEACGDCFRHVTSPELAEALAIRSAITYAIEERLDNVIIASDCLSVVQRVTAEERDRSLFGPVIQDIKTLMASFSACSVRHVSRLQNNVAHCLARSLDFSSRSVWPCVPPVCIRDAICTDNVFR